ncbi:hypothetical protein SAMN05660964_00553 [Thiothrix caldifontis]|jgi:hypothetical protein|uniref:Lipoprotein n=1 Tax=Thiothrix caldifontis TaxID=525918 RepID=A0A1H3X448_9GAMM|nr:hypothetical protein [Thiothrix caldifontis]SDZ93288.1 hypothetical protein SAMN05660964_00553 [Thiothrix caldifontis]
MTQYRVLIAALLAAFALTACGEKAAEAPKADAAAQTAPAADQTAPAQAAPAAPAADQAAPAAPK